MSPMRVRFFHIRYRDMLARCILVLLLFGPGAANAWWVLEGYEWEKDKWSYNLITTVSAIPGRTPNPCYGRTGDRLCKTDAGYFAYFVADSGREFRVASVGGLLKASYRYMYLEDMMLEIQSKGLVMKFRSLNPSRVGLPLRICFEQNGTNSSNGVSFPPCMTVPPPEVSCDLTDKSIVLEHGTLTTGEVEGDVASARTLFVCSQEYKAKVYMPGGDNIPMGAGLQAEIRLNGELAGGGSTLVGHVGGAELLVTSKLKTSGAVTPGSHQGSGIIIVEYL
ncbi:hypothetical protein [Serratia marcescens]|uniref:MrpH family fimbial adhesin n=1 Tax=Serratia marcescens TaxID=615 RepID=UPI000B6823F0|nr:hypothetical protein [Serratia marcescens]OUI68980.1 hypothetical protein AZZ99_003271 [Serratia marcescens]HEJ0329751.1 hypothetical protein [Serratia marcescens]